MSSNQSRDNSRQTGKPPVPRRRKNTKITGEASEAEFLNRSFHLGFGVAKPWGDSRRYDFILDNGECLHRIQVKCTESIRARAYETRATYTTGRGRAVYTRKDIDFIAAHVVPLDIWYIIPVEVCTPAPMLRFYPHRKAKIMRLEPYREAWHLILPKESNHVMDLHASADLSNAHVGTDAFVRPPSGTGHVGTDAFVRPPSSTGHVGTAALGCPPSTARQSSSTSDASVRHRIKTFRSLCTKTKPIRVDPSLAPWPIPRLKILLPRQGKHVLPDTSEE